MFDPETGALLRSVTEMRGKSVTSIDFAKTQSLWVGTENGLFKLNPYNGAIVSRVPNLPSAHVLSLATDVSDKLWVGTTEGLAWVSLTTGRANVHEAFRRQQASTDDVEGAADGVIQ